MKFIVIFIICLLTFSVHAGTFESQFKEDIVTESFETLRGFLVGAFESSTKIESCFDDSVNIFKHFKSAFSKLRGFDHIGVTSGLQDIGLAFAEVPIAIKRCNNTKNIMTKIEGLAKLFANPSMLVVKTGKNIIWYSKDIIKEAKAAIEAQDNKNYFEMGRQIGKIANVVFLGAEIIESLKNQGVEFFEGLLHGIDSTYFKDARVCIDKITGEAFTKISADIKDLSWKNIKRSVKDVENIVSVLKGVIIDCKIVSDDTKAFLDKIVEAIKHTKFCKEALNAMKHPFKFYRMVENIKTGLNKEGFFDAGHILGDFIAKVLHLN